MSDLTAKRRRFVLEYLIDLNVTQAAIRAGYSPKTAMQQGSWLLSNVDVAAEIRREIAEQEKRTRITADRVLEEIAAIGFGDMGDYAYIDPNTGRLVLDVTGLPEGGTALIQEITQEEWVEGRGEQAERVRKTKFKLYSKLDALEKLAKHLKLYDDGVIEHHHDHDHRHVVRHITVEEVRAEVEEMFSGTRLLPPPLVPTKH